MTNDNYWSYGYAISRSENLNKHPLFDKSNVVHINACRTKAECKDLVDVWNNQYKANNRSIW